MGVFRYAVQLTWPGTGSPGYNVWHGRTANDVGPFEDLNSLIGGLNTFYNGMAQFFPPGVTVTGPPEVVMGINSSPTFESVSGFTVAGGASSSSFLPLATAACVSWRTTAATRSGRGRTFISPLAQNCLDTNGTPTAGMVSSVNTIAAAFIDSFDGALGGAWGVWSEKDQVLRDFVSGSMRDTFAVLTSRRD